MQIDRRQPKKLEASGLLRPYAASPPLTVRPRDFACKGTTSEPDSVSVAALLEFLMPEKPQHRKKRDQ